jgi:hypothetical protein
MFGVGAVQPLWPLSHSELQSRILYVRAVTSEGPKINLLLDASDTFMVTLKLRTQITYITTLYVYKFSNCETNGQPKASTDPFSQLYRKGSENSSKLFTQ